MMVKNTRGTVIMMRMDEGPAERLRVKTNDHFSGSLLYLYIKRHIGHTEIHEPRLRTWVPFQFQVSEMNEIISLKMDVKFATS